MARRREALRQEHAEEAAHIDDTGRESEVVDTKDDSPPIVDANEWAQAHADALSDRRYLELVAQCELYRSLQDSMEEIIADTKAAASAVKSEIDRLVKELDAPKRMVGRGFSMTRSVSTTKKINPVRLTDYGVSLAIIKACTEVKRKEIVTIRKAGSSTSTDAGEEE